MRILFLLAMLPGCGSLWVSDTDVLPLYDQDGDGFYAPEASAVGEAAPYDCDDSDAYTYPGATDYCDGTDEDCNGVVDDGSDRRSWYVDADQDGHGDETAPRLACDQPPGFIAMGGDCDDGDPDVHPDAIEICNGVDDDCDTRVDMEDDSLSDPLTWYRDADSDGWGSADKPVDDCVMPSGYVSQPGDCNDEDDAISPDAVETCDGVDNDCDGAIDDDDAEVFGGAVWYRDSDADGFGDSSVALTACTAPTGYVGSGLDCDDHAADVYPYAPEMCDGADHDCDGNINEPDSADAATVYADADGDGYGDPAVSQVACPDSGWIVDSTDCDDTEAGHHPGAAEECGDGYDDDCDGNAGPCTYSAGGLFTDTAAPSFSGPYDTEHAVAVGRISGSDQVIVGLQSSPVPQVAAYTIPSTGIGVGALGPATMGLKGTPSGTPPTFPTFPARSLSGAQVAITWTGGSDVLMVAAPLGGDVFGQPVLYVPGGLISDLYYSPTQFTSSTVNVSGVTAAAKEFFYVSDTGHGVVRGIKIGHYIGYYAGTYVIEDESYSYYDGSTGFGNEVTADGDFDADGNADVLISDSSEDVYLFESGWGDTTSADAIISSGTSATGFGDALMSSTDFNGDGYEDLVVGAPTDNRSGKKDSGALYVFDGPLTSSISGTGASVTLLGDAPSLALGTSVAPYDLDDDGNVDYLVGVDTGVLVFDGTSVGSVTSSAATYEFVGGSYVLASPDVTADGEDDFIIYDPAMYVFGRQEL